MIGLGPMQKGRSLLVQLGRSPPKLGWSIASIVVGTLAGLVGAVTTGVIAASHWDDGAPVFWLFAAFPYATCAANITIGTINVTRWKATRGQPPEDEYEEIEMEEEEWSKGPSPGVSVSFEF